MMIDHEIIDYFLISQQAINWSHFWCLRTPKSSFCVRTWFTFNTWTVSVSCRKSEKGWQKVINIHWKTLTKQCELKENERENNWSPFCKKFSRKTAKCFQIELIALEIVSINDFSSIRLLRHHHRRRRRCSWKLWPHFRQSRTFHCLSIHWRDLILIMRKRKKLDKDYQRKSINQRNHL